MSRAVAIGLKLLLALASLVVTLFLVEGLLALAGYPRQLHSQVANPPNYSMWVDFDEFQYRWETNSQGIRYREIPLRKSRGERRVFVVGDSFTDGEGVEVKARFTNRMEQAFQKAGRPVSFINAGLGGQGVLQYARLFRWIGTRYEPDALLICVNTTDVADASPDETPDEIYSVVRGPTGTPGRLVHRLWPRIWGRLRLALDRLGERESVQFLGEGFDVEAVTREARAQGIDEARIRAWRERLPREWVDLANQDRMAPYLLGWGLFRPWFHTVAVDIEGPQAEQRWQATATLLSAMAEEARQRDMEVAVVFQPNLYLYDRTAHEPGSRFPFHYLGGTVRPEWAETETEIQRRLAGWAAAEKVPFLDLTEEFRRAAEQGEPLHFELDGHWNERGHAVAGEAMTRWLLEEEVFSF